MADTTDTIVRFAGVEKTYDGQSLVVKSLDLEIARGEFLTLLGPSGSGKTTTLMMLAGFEQPTKGEIFLDGRPVSRLPPWKRDIGMVFQSYALFPHLTVAENVAFPLAVRKMPKAEIERRVARALATVRLEGFENRRPAQLSGGQQQRVALARALVFEPKLVLMDEPLGALDKQLRESMQYELKHLHEKLGLTFVYVTHDQSEALTMSDRVAVFNDGRIQQLASPAELYERPKNAFVARFIGENNRLSGTVRERFGERCLVEVAGVPIKAVAGNIGGAGSATTLSLRPERVSINSPIAQDNEVQGEVLETIYHGDHLRVRLALLGHDDFIVKLSNRPGQLRLAPGQKVKVSWLAADCRALDAE
ncbi:MAG: polyamine-transporting ATPase [Geminicoccaceae bacterium]|jgi:putative spermidine/putrescine transport system ATP-binding protein|nr:MAG: polyamine-transporting ATPase [Geminicoccaceae bacterium]